MFCLSPVGPTQLRELDASVGASGPHDFAVRNNISRPHAVDRSQAHHPPCDPVARKTLPRPPHPHPASVTIAIRPSGGVGWRKFVEMICPTGEAKYFCKGDSTALSTNCLAGKSPDAQKSSSPGLTGRSSIAELSDESRSRVCGTLRAISRTLRLLGQARTSRT